MSVKMFFTNEQTESGYAMPAYKSKSRVGQNRCKYDYTLLKRYCKYDYTLVNEEYNYTLLKMKKESVLLKYQVK